MIDLDRDLTIFAIAVFVFFICPIGLVVAAVIEDKRSRYRSRSRSIGPSVQWSDGPMVHPMTNDQ